MDPEEEKDNQSIPIFDTFASEVLEGGLPDLQFQPLPARVVNDMARAARNAANLQVSAPAAVACSGENLPFELLRCVFSAQGRTASEGMGRSTPAPAGNGPRTRRSPGVPTKGASPTEKLLGTKTDVTDDSHPFCSRCGGADSHDIHRRSPCANSWASSSGAAACGAA